MTLPRQLDFLAVPDRFMAVSRWLTPTIGAIAAALLGGLAFAFVGGLGAALSLGSKRGGLLAAVVVLPLLAPPVIFGAAALDAMRGGNSPLTAVLLLGAYAAAAVALAPVGMAAACRNALD